MIRLIVSDIDGTLLSGHNTIHPDNIAAIAKAMQRGIHFAVASGRFAASCSHLLCKHGLENAFVIAGNGGQTLDRPFGQTLSLHTIAPKAARAMVDILEASGIAYCLFSRDMVAFRDKEMYEEHTAGDEGWIAPQILQSGMVFGAGKKAMEQAVLAMPMKTLCMPRPGEEEAFAWAKAACAAVDGLAVTSSWVDNMEVMPAGVDKGMAVRALAKRLGIAREEILAFGDNENDVSMLEYAGIGVAMGNARPEIKAIADHVTAVNEEGGVAVGIRAFCLEK